MSRSREMILLSVFNRLGWRGSYAANSPDAKRIVLVLVQTRSVHQVISPAYICVRSISCPRSRTPAESTIPRLFVGLVDAVWASRARGRCIRIIPDYGKLFKVFDKYQRPFFPRAKSCRPEYLFLAGSGRPRILGDPPSDGGYYTSRRQHYAPREGLKSRSRLPNFASVRIAEMSCAALRSP
jgi:hypothetical protein